MTRDEAKQMLPLIQQWVGGKTLEYHAEGGQWREIQNPVFDRAVSCYRIKPEPREWWMLILPNEQLPWSYTTKGEAMATAAKVQNSFVVHVREVL